ncbi:MAG: hypothetical protein DDT32_00433 [Syntrophomonadaceae bacterium]|nr:hypothetical protein [Bacillota bacterium]
MLSVFVTLSVILMLSAFLFADTSSGLIARLRPMITQGTNKNKVIQVMHVKGLDALAVQAGMSARQLVSYMALLSFGGATIAWVATGNIFLLTLGFLLGGVVPRYFAQRHAMRRLAMLESQLDGTLNGISSALRAGASLGQAISGATLETTGVIHEALQEADRLIRLGAPAAEALSQIADQTGSQDLASVAVAAQVQSRAGGNLAEAIDSATFTIRERRTFRARLSALTAQGKMSGKVATALPIMFLVPVLLINPEYMSPMIDSPTGRVIAIICVGMIGLGWVFVRRVTSFEE